MRTAEMIQSTRYDPTGHFGIWALVAFGWNVPGLVGGDGWTKAGSTLAYDLAFNGIKGSFMMLGRGALNEFSKPIIKSSIVGNAGFINDIFKKLR